jgi:ABC-type multidrug transport system ATPase subunit
MTLLLGPPSSGKTTLLLALAGKLRKDLKVRKLNREMLFNKLLYDCHITEMTWQ